MANKINMTSDLIKKHLEKLKHQKKFDDGFVDILLASNESSEDGKTTATEILKVVKQRYVENKKNKT